MAKVAYSVTAILLFASAAFAAGGQWTLTSADFHTQQVNIKAIDDAGVHAMAAGGGAEVAVPYDQFLELEREVIDAPSTAKFVLHLAGGDHMAGEPTGIKGNDLLWSSTILGQVSIPMKRLTCMTRPGAPVPETRGRDDAVVLSNGDSLHGIIAGFADGKLTVQADAGASDVPMASVSQINFAASAGAQPSAVGFRVRFEDGSSIVAASIAAANDKLDLKLSNDVMRTVDLNRIAAIEQVNGPVSWLSSRPTIENLYVPFIGPARSNVAKMDRNWTGRDAIRFGSQQFAHGIGVHSYSRLSWSLDGSYAVFRTRYAIDTRDANTRADVTVRILLDDKVVHEQTHVRVGMLSPVITQPVGAAKKLTLEVDYGDNLDTQDRFNWIEPALVKGK